MTGTETTATDVRLRRALDEATRGLAPGDGLAQRVRAGAARRHRARRLRGAGLVTAALVAGAVAAPPALHWWERSSQGLTAPAESDSWVDAPPRGDLAGDAAYVAAALRAWQEGRSTRPATGLYEGDRGIYEDLLGEPRVVWAGTTPAGPAAVLAQEAHFHPHENYPPGLEGPGWVTAFIGVDAAGEPVLVGDDYSRDETVHTSWYVDPARRYLAVLDTGEPTGTGSRWEYGPDGTQRLVFEPLEFSDGIAVVERDPGVDTTSTWVARLPYRSSADVRGTQGIAFPAQEGDRSLPWTADERGTVAIAGTLPPAPERVEELRGTWRDVLQARTTGPRWSDGGGSWLAAGELPDGRALVVGHRMLGYTEPAHSYAVVVGGRGTTVVHGGVVDPAAALPIQVLLPDGLGRVVGSDGASLAHRTGSGNWVDAGEGMALVPASATEVRVTRAGGTAVVPLQPHPVGSP